MNKNFKIRILSILTLFLPMNIFVIGDYLGAGIQFPLIKYQITYMGSMAITIFRDITYILNGVYTNKTTLSVIVWVLGVLVLVLGIVIIWVKIDKNNNNLKLTGILIITSAFLFLSSTIIQYGPLFKGPAGLAIPIGLPVLFVIGGWMYHEGCKEKEADKVESEQEFVDEI